LRNGITETNDQWSFDNLMREVRPRVIDDAQGLAWFTYRIENACAFPRNGSRAVVAGGIVRIAAPLRAGLVAARWTAAANTGEFARLAGEFGARRVASTPSRCRCSSTTPCAGASRGPGSGKIRSAVAKLTASGR
jgi:hypothetical protein